MLLALGILFNKQVIKSAWPSFSPRLEGAKEEEAFLRNAWVWFTCSFAKTDRKENSAMFYQLHAHPLSISLMNYYQVLNIILKEPHLLRGFSMCSIFEEGMSLARKWIANKRKTGIMI